MTAENENTQMTRRDFLEKAALATVAVSSLPSVAKAMETVTGVSFHKGEKKMDVIKTFTPKNYGRLIGTAGFSDALLKNHFTLYQGYVKNTNGLADTLTGMVKDGKSASPEYAELKRRFGWEFNGMRLHELYFDNMSKSSASLTSASHDLAHAIDDQFGSYNQWQADFVAAGSMRGIGWVVLAFDPQSNRFFNVWINEHDGGHLSGAIPLLVMDVFEHAYVLDYGLKKIDYIEAFLKAIDWTVVSKRFGAER
ncbi:MAG: hypothetical protein KCHDKBKB_02556 [Elusimicrobia bacterium]|nr:hypothetical protein [Elusimicrobiota bacterium]